MGLCQLTILIFLVGFLAGESPPFIPFPPPPPQAIGPQCDQGWTLYQPSGMCIKVVEDQLTWRGARRRCKGVFADLVAITDNSKNKFVKRLAKRSGNYWIGLNDMDRDGTYHWLDYPIKADFYKWLENPGANNKACVVMLAGQNGKWAEKICKNKNAYICERRAPIILN